MKKISFWPIWNEIQKVRENEWKDEAIKLANNYLSQDPYNIEAYMQIIDIYYVLWELEKAEKPIDFILANNLEGEWIDKWLLNYIKAVLLSERTQWTEAKQYIKIAIKYNISNLEYKRLLATIEFWSGNKTKWYNLLTDILKQFQKDADILLDAVNMALNLWYIEDAKWIVNMYFDKKDEISFFSRGRNYYDEKMSTFKQALFDENHTDDKFN